MLVAAAAALGLCIVTACPQRETAPTARTGSGSEAAATPNSDEVRVLFDEPSTYGRVIVVEKGALRCLKFAMAGGDQSCIDSQEPAHIVHEYVRLLAAGLLFAPPSPRLLMVGLGGGRAARLFLEADKKMTMDVVEINPTVIEVADEYFGVRASERLRLHAADGRRFLERSQGTWDLILLDAFGDDFIPFHLTTREFLHGVAAHTAPGGAVVANLWTNDPPLFHAMVRTYAEVFPRLYLFRAALAGNAILVARRGAEGPSCAALEGVASNIAPRYALPFELEGVARRCEPGSELPLADAPVLSDAAPEVYDALRR